MMTAVALIGLTALLSAFAAVTMWSFFHARNGEWHTFSGNRMRRRRPDGSWEIRNADPEENDDHIQNFPM